MYYAISAYRAKYYQSKANVAPSDVSRAFYRERAETFRHSERPVYATKLPDMSTKRAATWYLNI
jgi:hypothetical protein